MLAAGGTPRPDTSRGRPPGRCHPAPRTPLAENGATLVISEGAKIVGSLEAVGGLAGVVHALASGGGSEDRPPVRRIHSDRTLESGSNRYNLEYWRKQPTEDIIESLKPGRPESLKVKPDGRIVNGNTRIQVLQARGVDVDKLPREVVE